MPHRKVTMTNSFSNVELGNLANLEISGACPDCAASPCICSLVAATAQYHFPEEVDGDACPGGCDGAGSLGADGDQDVPCPVCSARAAEDRAIDAYEDAMDRD